jgi:hypothetical protein
VPAALIFHFLRPGSCTNHIRDLDSSFISAPIYKTSAPRQAVSACVFAVLCQIIALLYRAYFCKCNCNKLFFVDDMQSLGLVLQGRSLPIIPKPATETSHFIAQTMMNADQVVRDATNAASRHGTVITSEHQQELYYTGAADWASRMGSNLSLSTKNSLGRTFGRDTIVDLASSQWRSIQYKIDFNQFKRSC